MEIYDAGGALDEGGGREVPYFDVREAGDALFWYKGGGRCERKESKGGAYMNLQK